MHDLTRNVRPFLSHNNATITAGVTSNGADVAIDSDTYGGWAPGGRLIVVADLDAGCTDLTGHVEYYDGAAWADIAGATVSLAADGLGQVNFVCPKDAEDVRAVLDATTDDATATTVLEFYDPRFPY